MGAGLFCCASGTDRNTGILLGRNGERGLKGDTQGNLRRSGGSACRACPPPTPVRALLQPPPPAAFVRRQAGPEGVQFVPWVFKKKHVPNICQDMLHKLECQKMVSEKNSVCGEQMNNDDNKSKTKHFTQKKHSNYGNVISKGFGGKYFCIFPSLPAAFQSTN